MKRRLFLSLALMLATAPLTAVAQTDRMGVERFGLYVVATDLNRAGAFYTALFGAEPQVKTPALWGYDVSGSLFAVASKQAYAPNATTGGNVVPYIRVRDIDAEFARVKRVAPASLQSPAVVTEGTFRFFKVTDPDGNVLEFFSLAAPPAAARP